MLKSITLNNVASYKKDAQTLGPLKPLNYIYGENGCGKSTIAELLDCEFNESDRKKDFSNCSVCEGWKDEETRRVCLYDAAFVDRVIGATEIDGVFVMGEDAPELEVELKEIEAKKEVNLRLVSELSEAKEKLKGEIIKREQVLGDECWDIGMPHKEEFKDAYTGNMGSRKAFSIKCVQYAKKKTESKSLEELKEAARIFFSPDGKPDSLELLPPLTWDSYATLKGSPILSTVIKGKEDTTVAELIEALDNSDWVDQGREYYKSDVCPFCQQKTPPTLQADLESYFDETYKQQKGQLRQFSTLYASEMQRMVSSIQGYKSRESGYFQYKDIQLLLEVIEATITYNKGELAKKEKEPSEVVTITDVSEALEGILKVINESNQKIQEYNSKIESFSKGKTQLKEDVWVYIGKAISAAYEAFVKFQAEKNQKITEVEKQSKAAKDENKALEARIDEIGDRLKNISKPAKEINSTLQKFGFSNFTIEKKDDGAKYSIVRENGELASTTLSEGEKTFIAFLYFYQTIKGVSQDKNSLDDKIVIFDDPVSSLDSKVLYVVSRLIRDLIYSREELKIHQFFILTHNLYFFKEISPRKMENKLLKKSTFWLIRKASDKSIIEPHGKNNPVRSSYQMLWDEVKHAEQNPDMDIRNTLRRILENYFQIFGDVQLWKLPKAFEGEYEQICHSLIDWINDGSHALGDDLFITHTPEIREKYLKVFEAIFVEHRQEGHFELMMGRPPQSIE